LDIDVIYWINLDTNIQRRVRCEKMFAEHPFFQAATARGVEIIRIVATTPQNVLSQTTFEWTVEDADGWRSEITHPHTTGLKEYACSVSHFRAIHEFAKTAHRVALILEDDMTMDFYGYWDKSIPQVIREAPPDWEIIQLCYISAGRAAVRADFELIEYNNTNRLYSTGAYLIHNGAAKSMIDAVYDETTEKYCFPNALNDFLYDSADHYIYTMNTTYCYRWPYFIYSYNEISDIHQEHIIFHNMSRATVETEWVGAVRTQTDRIMWSCLGAASAVLSALSAIFARRSV
jgi:GR25 family glycosyltransferase involved in LPS biosynthesis